MLRRNRVWRRLPVRAAITVVALTIAAGAVARPVFHGDPVAVAGLVVAAVALALQAADALRAARQRASTPTAELADSLALVLEEDWREESDSRRLRTPQVLPLAWAQTTRRQLADRASTDVTEDAGVTRGATAAGTAVAADDASGDRSGFAGQIGPDFEAATERLAKAYSKVPGGRLVVIGQPGAGKSVLAIMLLLGLLKARTAGHAVPVFLPISTWDPLVQDFDSWLVQYLAIAYYRGDDEPPRRLVRDNLVIPILDGLDEMPEEARRAAVRAINRAIAADRPVILTSRAAEYEDLITGGAPALRRAPVVEISPVSAAAAIGYLRSIDWPDGTSWDAVFEQLDTQPRAQVALVLSTPLMLGLARSVYGRLGGGPAELLDARFDSRHAIEDFLTDRVIDAAYVPDRAPDQGPPRSPDEDKATDSRWTGAQARRWLAFIAGHMHRHRERDLVWWLLAPRVVSHWAAPILSAACGALFTTAVSAWFWLSQPADPDQDGDVLATSLSLGALLGSVFAVLMLTMWYATSGAAPRQLSLVRRGSLRRLGRGFTTGALAAGFLLIPIIGYGALVVTLTSRWTLRNSELFIQAVFGAALLVSALGIALAVQSWCNATAAKPQKADPLAILRQDRRSALVSSLFAAVAGLLVLPMATAGLIAGSLVTKLSTGWAGWPGMDSAGLVVQARRHDVWTFFGGTGWRLAGGFLCPALVLFVLVFLAHAWPRFLIARVILAFRRDLPLRLPAFLTDARRRDLLRLTAGTYQFRHARLQENLSRLNAPTAAGTPGAGAAGPAAFWAGSFWTRRRLAVACVAASCVVVAAVALVRLPVDTSRDTIIGRYASGEPKWTISKDGQRLAAVIGSRLIVRDLGSDYQTTLSENVGPVFNLDFSPDGRAVALGIESDVTIGPGAPRTWAIWNVNSPEPLVRGVPGYTFLAHGRALIAQRKTTGSAATSTWSLVDVSTGRSAEIDTGVLDNPAALLQLDEDRQTFLRRNSNGEPEVADAATGRPVAVLRAPTGRIPKLAIMFQGKLAVAPSDDGFMVWDMDSGRFVGTLAIRDERSLELAGGNVLVASTGGKKSLAEDDDTAELWDLAGGRPMASFTDPGGFSNFELSRDGAFLGAIVNSTHALHLWEVESRRELAEIPDVSSFRLLQPSGKVEPPTRTLVLTRSNDGKRYTLWGVAGQRLVDPVPLSPDIDALSPGPSLLRGGPFRSRSGSGSFRSESEFESRWVAPNPDLGILAVVEQKPDNSQVVRFYDTVMGNEEAVTPPMRVELAQFSPDWTVVAVSGRDRMTLFDTRTASPVAAFPYHGQSSYYSAFEFSPDGRTLATYSFDEEVVRVWDAHTGRLIRTCAGHAGPVQEFAYSGDGRTIVTAGADKTLRLWDVP